MKGISPSVALIAGAIAILVPVFVVILVNRWKLIKTSEDYLVAGRRAHWALAMASVTSMYIWGSSVMGSAEGAVGNGLSGVWIYPMYSAGLWVFGIWASKLRDVFPYALSYTEYFKHRFDTKLHVGVLCAAIATSFSGAWIQGLAAGHVFVGLTGGAVPYWVGVLIMGIAVIIYALVAGLWGSLISTWIFTLIAMPICAIVGIGTWIAIGGPSPIVDQAYSLVQQGKLDPAFLQIFRPSALVNYLIPVLAWAFFSLPMQQDYWQTAFAVKDPKKVGKAFRHAGNWWFFMPFISSSLGFAALVLIKSGKMPEVPGSEAYAAVVGQFLPPWYGVLFIWLVLAATVGTVGAAMVAIGNIVGNDIYRTYFNQTATDDQVKKVVRIVVAIATICVIIISLMPLSILMVLLFMPMYCAPFVWGFIRSQYNKNLSSGPILLGGIIGFIVGTYMFLGMNMWGWAMIVAFASAGLISEIGSAISPANFDFAKLKATKAR
jgi:SSS family solute:Na+ symporter